MPDDVMDPTLYELIRARLRRDHGCGREVDGPLADRYEELGHPLAAKRVREGEWYFSIRAAGLWEAYRREYSRRQSWEASDA